MIRMLVKEVFTASYPGLAPQTESQHQSVWDLHEETGRCEQPATTDEMVEGEKTYISLKNVLHKWTFGVDRTCVFSVECSLCIL